MNNPDIALIINSFNRLELLKSCIHVFSTWVGQSTFNGQVVGIIYDAGSTDGSRRWLEDKAQSFNFPIEVILPAAGDDTSFAAGLNRGVAYAEERFSSLRYLLFYETDNQILASRPLSQAMEQLEKKDYLAACGFTVRKHDGTPAGVGLPFPSVFNFALGKNLVHYFQLEQVPYKWEENELGVEFSEVDVVYTSPLLVRLDAWKDSGGLDEDVFPFSDCDVDWAYRLKKIGWKMGVIKTDAVIHDNMESISNWSKSRSIQSHRGRLRYFKQHFPIKIFMVWPIILFLRHLIELALAQLLVREPSRRGQLSNQFYSLLKSCIRGYE